MGSSLSQIEHNDNTGFRLSLNGPEVEPQGGVSLMFSVTAVECPLFTIFAEN